MTWGIVLPHFPRRGVPIEYHPSLCKLRLVLTPHVPPNFVRYYHPFGLSVAHSVIHGK